MAPKRRYGWYWRYRRNALSAKRTWICIAREARGYLRDRGVEVDDVFERGESRLPVSATPSLLFVDGSGKLLGDGLAR